MRGGIQLVTSLPTIRPELFETVHSLNQQCVILFVICTLNAQPVCRPAEGVTALEMR
jgi:hypothetical protein